MISSGQPYIDGKFINYPRFKKEWIAYRETYHAIVSDDLAAKNLGEKCVKGDAWKRLCYKTSNYKTSNYKTSNYKTSHYKTSKIQNAELQNVESYKR
jgi:hypothetical protein